jgi:hypothetical protein
MFVTTMSMGKCMRRLVRATTIIGSPEILRCSPFNSEQHALRGVHQRHESQDSTTFADVFYYPDDSGLHAQGQGKDYRECPAVIFEVISPETERIDRRKRFFPIARSDVARLRDDGARPHGFHCAASGKSWLEVRGLGRA